MYPTLTPPPSSPGRQGGPRRGGRANQTREGSEAKIGILGTNAALNRSVPVGVGDARPGSRIELFTPRDADLPLDEIGAGHHFGHRVLDLQPRVHFQEVEGAVFVEQKLDRSRARVVDLAGNGRSRRRDPAPQVRRDGDRRRLLDDFLVASLDRALAFNERHDRTVLVAEELYFDVPRAPRPAEIYRRVAGRRARLGRAD